MDILIKATLVFALFLVVFLGFSKITGRPLEWFKAVFFAIGFTSGSAAADYFHVTGMKKYLVMAAVALPFIYLGQYLQNRKRPAA